MLNSEWSDQPVTIDGDASEWKGSLFALEDGRFLIGARNDDSSLYLCLGSNDARLRRQILHGGLTVWFDPSGGKGKVFGIRSPARRGPARPDSAGPREYLRADFVLPADSLAMLEILEPGGSWRLVTADASGFDLKLRDDDETLACELRIPLQRDGERLPGIGAAPGRTIGIGVETPKPGPRGRPDARERPEGDPRGGGGWRTREGGSGGRPGPGRGAGGSSGRRPPGAFEPLKLWAKIHLASSPGSK